MGYIIYNHLLKDNIQIPPRIEQAKDEKYVGAYVKTPQVGQHKWIVSFDINSLYPHLIMQYNISPEKMIGVNPEGISVNNMIKKKVELNYLKIKVVLLLQMVLCFKIDNQGFLPKIMEKMYNDRVEFKKLEFEAKKNYQKQKTQSMQKKLVDVIIFNGQRKYH